MQIDILVPQNNEKELLARARELGYSDVVFLYPFKSRGEILEKKKKFPNTKIGTFILANRASDLKKLPNLYLDSDLIAVQTFAEDIVRSAANNPRIDIICGITTAHGRDHLEYRRSNLNAIVANIMKDNKMSYGLNFAQLYAGKGTGSYPLAKILGREMQNIRLTRRKIPIVFASFASDVWQMRLPENLSAFSRVLGLNHPQSKAAVSTAIEAILKRKEHRRSKEFVRPGIRLVE
jgi:RNase P/RNase MRP subunit p30